MVIILHDQKQKQFYRPQKNNFNSSPSLLFEVQFHPTPSYWLRTQNKEVTSK